MLRRNSAAAGDGRGLIAVGALRWFRWLPAGPVPDRQDLRRLGWCQLPTHGAAPAEEVCIDLACPALLSTAEWFALVAAPPDRRQAILITGVEESADRERLLRLGFGDAIGLEVTLGELEVRAGKLADGAASVPRTRVAGRLRLDLVLRDARVAGRRAGLHPREFALLWRLAECPGVGMTPDQLLRDVWQMAFRPETNSLAVHISRLRSKLRALGAEGMIQTTNIGGYRLVTDPALDPVSEPRCELALDGFVRLREEIRSTQQEASHEA